MGAEVKNPNVGLIPGLERSPGVGNRNPIPVFLPGKFHGRRSLAGRSPGGREESDMTERACASGAAKGCGAVGREDKAGLWREEKETDMQQEADLEKPRGENEGDSVRVMASDDSFSFPGSDPLKHPLGPQDISIFVISTAIKKISMAQGNVRILP